MPVSARDQENRYEELQPLAGAEGGDTNRRRYLETMGSLAPDMHPDRAEQMLGDPEDTNADVFFKEDVFHSVLVAAFGGVKANLEKNEFMLVHPSIMFLCCVTLFMIQLSVITFLRLDMDLTDEFVKYDENHHWRVHGDLVLTAKLMMMLVVQLLLFEDIRGVLQLLAFVLNPTSWSDVKRPDPEKMSLRRSMEMVWKPWFLAPWAIGALIMKLVVAYFVCVDSVSIILASENIKDAIFNALAMVFVVELATTWWEVCSAVFHLDPFSEFQFLIASDEFKLKMEKEAFIKIPRCMVILKRGYGARKLEILFTYIIIFVTYFRQLNVLMYALHTNVLPVARDICTAWRYQTGRVQFLKKTAMIVKWAMAHILVYDPSEDIIDRCDPDPDVGGYCDENFGRMKTSDVKEMWAVYPKLMLGGTIGISVVFIFPQILYFYSRAIKMCIRRVETIPTHESLTEEKKVVTMAMVEQEMQGLKDEVRMYKQQNGLR